MLDDSRMVKSSWRQCTHWKELSIGQQYLVFDCADTAIIRDRHRVASRIPGHRVKGIQLLDIAQIRDDIQRTDFALYDPAQRLLCRFASRYIATRQGPFASKWLVGPLCQQDCE